MIMSYLPCDMVTSYNILRVRYDIPLRYGICKDDNGSTGFKPINFHNSGLNNLENIEIWSFLRTCISFLFINAHLHDCLIQLVKYVITCVYV